MVAVSYTHLDVYKRQAEYQAKEAGLVDFKGSEEDVLAQIRALVTMLPANNEDDMSYDCLLYTSRCV